MCFTLKALLVWFSKVFCRIYAMFLSEIGEGNGTPLQYSCLDNPMDGGVWWAADPGVTQSRTRLSNLATAAAA